MRVLVEVIGRPLNLRGPQYAVGERLFLDTSDPRHREVIDAGWVQPVIASVVLPPASASQPAKPPVSAITPKSTRATKAQPLGAHRQTEHVA